jgi:hypothetical protein
MALPAVLSRALQLLAVVGGLFALAILTAPSASAGLPDPSDEMFFYREDGLFRFYDVRSDGGLPGAILGGAGYTKGWDSITGIDLDGRGQDEMFFYREDGLFRYYNVRSNGSLPSPIIGGDGYTEGWDIITAVDLGGDGQDEIFFYREDGLYRYYDIRSNGSLPAPLSAGSDYETGWNVISAVDIDGDGQDEMFFYREDGTYRFSNVTSTGGISTIVEGSGFTPGWTSISAVKLDGDLQDEMFFYRDDGLFGFYDVGADGSIGTPISEGTGYTSGWSSITAINLDGDHVSERVSRFTTFFDCCAPRVTNIRLMARQLNGHVILPGETFSIDAVLGPRTAADGYVPAGYMENGQGLCCVIGGGVSQFGTTIHNAVFWGGFTVVRHKPHSAWLSRYPLGIEATLSYVASDYRFTNDTPTPLTIRTSSTGTSVTVELWGYQGGWRMSGQHPPGNRSSSITVFDVGDSTARRVSATVTGDAPGQVKIVRRLTQAGSTKTQTWFWTYVG